MPHPTRPSPTAVAADARTRLELTPDRLRRRVDPATLPFDTTAEVDPLEGTIGQPRALDALEFGLPIRAAGYNLFVTGAPGSGRLSTIRDHLERFARTLPAPGDWVYVHDFAEPDRPRPMRLPTGTGRRLARDMDDVVAGMQREVARVFEGAEYQRRGTDIIGRVEERRTALQHEIEAFAAERGFGVAPTPTGVAVFPVAQGKPIPAEEVERLGAEERAALEKRSREIQLQLQADAREVRHLERQAAEEVVDLDRALATSAVTPLLAGLREAYAEQPEVLEFLAAVEADIPDHIPEIRGADRGHRGENAVLEGAGLLRRDDALGRYRVNVFVDNDGLASAPVVVERNPTYYNLVGRVEYRPMLGSVVTDFSQIRAGALHRANGGFLVLEAADVVAQPFAWEALKRSLRARELVIENLGEHLTAVPTSSLHPRAVPLDVKVVLIGSPLLHLLLQRADEGMPELFKVKVDFAPDMEWTDAHLRDYAAFIARWVRHQGLLHLDRTAVARVVEHGARLREDQRRLTTRLLDISDLVTEASFFASQAGRAVVRAEDVGEAIRRKQFRSNLAEERMRDLIERRTLVIETEGARVGQVNGLSVVELGDHSFGLPARITARVSLGRGSVESIEREIEMSGPIHSKGVLILSGYLAGTYGQRGPLAIRASLAFEQAYEEIDGDSASSTELYALLSALSGLPIEQGIAVTGSVNQRGDVQAVGGVTRKVEGFFATCRAQGLTGRQGVVIPAANVETLMLSDEVVGAVERGEFHMWAVSHVDEGVELLTGHPAGVEGEAGYPEDSVHGLVARRLREYAELSKAFAAPPPSNGRHPS